MKIVKSPLRYPGSKQKFIRTFVDILKKNNIQPDLFIEPFAGGLSISLHMLQNNIAKEIAIIEKDPLVASFWKVVFFDSEWLINRIVKTDITIEEWNRFKQHNPITIRDMALKCLFMNRTCFSGILKAGPIGGKKQLSQYRIDCRFNKKNIINKIEILSSYRNRIAFIEEGDFEEILVRRMKKLPVNTFFYFDPPYIKKAKNLYNFYFNKQDHARLKNFIKKLNFNWLLSYDYEPSLKNLYSEFAYCGFFNIRYTTTFSSVRPEKKEFLASNLNIEKWK